MQRAGFYPSRKLATRKARYFEVLNVWPLLGVQIVLLVIFMTAMGPPNLCTRRILPHLATVNHATPLLHANREDAMHVYILRDGSFYFGNSMVALNEIPRRIHEQVTGGAERRVYLQADGRAKYGDVKQVLDEVRKAGIENVSFLAERPPN